MRTHLNRVVFRKLLADQPIIHRGCLYHAPPYHAAATLPRTQRRLFFNIFRKPERQASEPIMDPGLDKMMEFTKMERLNARLPPPQDIEKALTSFVDHKLKHMQPLQDVQAQHMLRCLLYLQKRQEINRLDLAWMFKCLHALRRGPRQVTSAHHDLATAVVDEIHRRHSRINGGARLKLHEFKHIIHTLCEVQGTSAARDIVLENIQGKFGNIFGLDSIVWKAIISGFSKERNEQELIRSIELLTQYKVDLAEDWIDLKVAQFYAEQSNLEKAADWYNSYKQLRNSTLEADPVRDELQGILLNLCLRTSQYEFGQSIIKDMTATTPSKHQWDLILEWAAGNGKGADEINRMMGVMERSNKDLPEAERRIPDVDTINRLVKLAVSREDPYLAERFMALGRERGIEPDAQTLILQMEYRLAIKDIDGALTVYAHLQTHYLSAKTDVPVVNALIRAMCVSGRQDFESIMNVAADLSDRRARFEPATVSALSVLHLSRDELHDVIDLLNTHVYSFTNAERASVRDTFVEYCLNASTTTAQAWDAYIIFRQVFDETPREQRVQIMNDFFRRERPDMAVHVFNHMRSHTRADTIPSIDTYVSCFLGIARSKDEESLEVVYNQFKLDYSVEPNTYLYNALILAYTACGFPRKALEFWDDIAASREGPTINSIHLALRACEDSPWGDEKARKIWMKLSRTGIELDQSLWASFAGALAGNGNVQGAIETIEDAHARQGADMDVFLIGSLYNAAPGQAKKNAVEVWAKENYPEIWEDLSRVGMRTDEETEMEEFNIDRHVDP